MDRGKNCKPLFIYDSLVIFKKIKRPHFKLKRSEVICLYRSIVGKYYFFELPPIKTKIDKKSSILYILRSVSKYALLFPIQASSILKNSLIVFAVTFFFDGMPSTS